METFLETLAFEPGRMRAIGFYITDFVGDQKGFTVSRRR
jgi:hypothetical protein